MAYPWYSSGVRVFIDSAWISSRMRSPSAAYTSWWRWIGRLPAKAGETMTAREVLAVALHFEVGAFAGRR